MAFSINQVRHLFVASDPKSANAAVSDLGDTAVCGVAGQFIYFKHFGQGGVVSSDMILVENILSAKLTPGANLKTKLYKHTLTVSDAVAGQVYVVKVKVQNYIGIGDQNTETRVATYRAKSGDTAATIAKGLRIALRAALGFQKPDTASSEASSGDAGNIANYNEPMFTVTGSSTSVIVSEVEGNWELGKFPAGHVARIPKDGMFLGEILDASGVAYNTWGSVAYASNGTCNDSGKKLADLEYFCMGARGDEYRGMGYPRNITTKYQVNPATDYDVIDIHYAYVGSNESVQKSEKDITILVPKNNTAFASAIDSLTGFGAGDPRRLIAAATLAADPTSLTFTSASATKTISMTSSKPVFASADVDWLTVTVSGNTVSVTAAANTSEGAAARTGNVTVMNSDGATVIVPVSQAA